MIQFWNTHPGPPLDLFMEHKSSSQKETLLAAGRNLLSFLAAQHYPAILIMILVVAAIRLPVDYLRIMTPTDNDFSLHIYFALDLLGGRPVPAYTLAHSLWQILLIGVWWLSRSRIGFYESAVGFQVLSSVASTLVLYFWYGALPGRPSPWLRAFFAVSLVVAAPVILPALMDGSYYFGYIGLANYHNPTVHMLRPFALLLFILAVEALARPRHSGWVCALSAVLMVLATFLKPSYTIVLLPALGLLALFWLYRRRMADWRLLILGIGLPAVLVLAVQYWYTYASGEAGSAIVWMPLAAVGSMSGFLAQKFMLSILFPLTGALLSFRSIRRDPSMVLAWLSFAAGAAQYYLLAESGPRLQHGNFLWGAQISLFVLFAASIRFLLAQNVKWKDWARPASLAQAAVYLLHLGAGIAYYLYCLNSPHYS